MSWQSGAVGAPARWLPTEPVPAGILRSASPRRAGAGTGTGWVGGSPPYKGNGTGQRPGLVQGQIPTPPVWGPSGLPGAGTTRGHAWAGLRLLPPPGTAGPSHGRRAGEAEPTSAVRPAGRCTSAQRPEGERLKGARAQASCSGATAGASAAPWHGRTRSPRHGRTCSLGHPWPKHRRCPRVTAERAKPRQKRCLPREAVPRGLKPFAGGRQSRGASGRFLASPAVLLHGTGHSAVAARGGFPAASS